MRVWYLKMGTVVITPRFGGVQILSQHRFSNKGDQAPRNKAMSKHFFDTSGDDKKMTSMPTTPITMILLVVVMISG